MSPPASPPPGFAAPASAECGYDAVVVAAAASTVGVSSVGVSLGSRADPGDAGFVVDWQIAARPGGAR